MSEEEQRVLVGGGRAFGKTHQLERMKQLMAERNWEAMSLYELELLRGMIEVCHDPEYIKAAQKKREERRKYKQMEDTEKPFQFDIKEYVEQTKKLVIDQTFLKAFYALSEEEQSQVADTLGRSHRSNMLTRVGQDYNREEYLRMKRIDVFLDQWIEEQTVIWVAREIKRIKDDPTFPLSVKE